MTPDEFIGKWNANRRSEAAASKEHFFDLCALLGVPTPNSDPTGEEYAFEKGVRKAAGGAGWADVWKRGCFGWEYKSRGGDLVAAHDQLLRYAGALENPPLLIASDMDRIVIRTNWTNQVTVQEEYCTVDLRAPLVRAKLAACWLRPEQWRPATTRQALTERAAAEFAELARRLRERGHAPQTVAHFVNRLVFCLFAEAVLLLPLKLVSKMLARARRRPHEFEKLAAILFGAMAERGGMVGYDDIPWFNGGLFDDAATLPLAPDDLTLLERVAKLDWGDIDVSILGTLFERGLDPDKRSQLGAHYTDRDKIEKLIDPVIRRPLRAEWAAAKAAIIAAQAEAARRKPAGRAVPGAAELAAFLHRLRGFRVLDPACGSGNFLYLSLLALKDLEHEVMQDAEALGLPPELYQVGPEQVLGIEINPYAAELARVSVWIGDIQWSRRHGFAPSQEPVLRKLDTIETRDAVLAPDGTPAVWPKVDVIVGNPPFLGGKRLRSVLGDATVASLFAAYAGRVPAEADLVCYWFELARAALEHGGAQRVGLVATNSIRGGANRVVLDRIERGGAIFEAWSDEAWTVEGAAVRVSLVCFVGPVLVSTGTAVDARAYPSPQPPPTRGGGDVRPFPPPLVGGAGGGGGANGPHGAAGGSMGPWRLDGVEVVRIHSDLTGTTGLDLTRARALAENERIALMGETKGGAFDVPGETAR